MDVQIIMTIVFCIVGIIMIMVIVSMSGTKGMSKMMKRAIKMEKNILSENEEELKDIYTRSANIEKEAIEIKAKAVKDGFAKKSAEDSKYCKYCGALIDDDSLFCKQCGKEQ